MVLKVLVVQSRYVACLLILGLIFSLFCCTSQNSCNDICQSGNGNLFTLRLSDTISINVPSYAESSGDQFFVYQDSILFLSSQRDRYTIHLFNVKSERYLKSISVDNNFLSEPGGFYVKSFDSIFLNQNMPPATVLIDTAGTIKGKWDLSGAPIAWNSPNDEVLEYMFAGFTHNRPFLVGDNKLLVTLNDIDIWYYRNRREHRNHGLFDLTNNKWDFVFGEYPCVVSNSGKVMYPFFLSQPYLTIKDSLAIVSFPISHEVDIYNWMTGSLIKRICLGDNELEIQKPLGYEEGEEDVQLRRNLIIQSGHYGGLYYHPEADLFTRVIVYQQPLKNSDGQLNSPIMKQSAILIFTPEFQIVGKYILDNRSAFSVNSGNFVPVSDGLLVPFKNRSSDNEFYYGGYFKFVDAK